MTVPRRTAAGVADGVAVCGRQAQGLATEPRREFRLSDRDFDRLRALLDARSGIRLPDSSRGILYGRLVGRLRALGLADFSRYCRLLESGERLETECFVNAMTTNVTAFFREPHHFDALAREMRPALEGGCSGRGAIRVWSAGTARTSTPFAAAISARTGASRSAERELMERLHPSAASASAMARPRPWLDPATTATRPRIPRSMIGLPDYRSWK